MLSRQPSLDRGVKPYHDPRMDSSADRDSIGDDEWTGKSCQGIRPCGSAHSKSVSHGRTGPLATRLRVTRATAKRRNRGRHVAA
jgi:hypothetical protein